MNAYTLFSALLLVSCTGTDSSNSQDTNVTASTVTNTAAQGSVWESAKQRGVNLRGVGQEPGWLIEISTGEQVLLVTDYGSVSTQYAYKEPAQYPQDNSQLYQLDIDTSLLIETDNCRDSMSGERFTLRLTLYQVGRTLKGCGRAL